MSCEVYLWDQIWVADWTWPFLCTKGSNVPTRGTHSPKFSVGEFADGYEVRGREDLDDAALGGSVSWKGLFLRSCDTDFNVSEQVLPRNLSNIELDPKAMVCIVRRANRLAIR